MRLAAPGILLITLASGCGGGTAAGSHGTTPSGTATPRAGAQTAAAASAARPTPSLTGRIARADLDPVLDAGLGRFLQGVDTEPDLDAGHFVGFRLRALYPQDPRFAAVDLGPGDTITRVNGQSIERPEQAIHVWNGLHVASELVVEYLRRGERRELRFTIED